MVESGIIYKLDKCLKARSYLNSAIFDLWIDIGFFNLLWCKSAPDAMPKLFWDAFAFFVIFVSLSIHFVYLRNTTFQII